MEICRVCESDQGNLNLTNRSNKDILKKLLNCANIEFDISDPLPKHLCLNCIQNLDSAYKFKIQCEYTDQKLRDAFAANDYHNFVENAETVGRLKQSSINISTKEVTFEDYTNVKYCESQILTDDPKIENGDTIGEENLDNCIVKKSFSQGGNFSFVSVETDRLNNIDENNEIKESYDKVKEVHDVIKKEEQYEEIEQKIVCSTENIPNTNDPILDSNIVEFTELSPFDNVADDHHQKTTKLRPKKEKRFVCDTCDEYFLVYSDFNQHKKTHGKERYQCSICGKWFLRRCRLKQHQAIHEGEKNFNCKLCQKQYSSRYNRDRHIRECHNKEKLFVCTECGRAFAQATVLQQHYTVHINDRNYECDVCQKRFKSKLYLNYHKTCHLPKEQRKLRIAYNRKYSANKITFICTYCGKQTSTAEGHAIHMRTHTGEKPYECIKCKKRFSNPASLRKHLRIHTGEKPYKCDQCDLSFRQHNHLDKHKLVHSGEKKHKCVVCMKSFALRGNLKIHMRLHTGETPYHCSVCPKKFHDLNGLKRHRQVHQRSDDVQTSTGQTLDM